MDGFFALILLAPVTALVALSIRKENPVFALLLCLAEGIVLLLVGMNGVQQLLEEVRRLQAYLPASSIWMAPLLKCCAVAVLVRIGAELCRDAGENSLAAKVELCGVVAVLTISLPLLRYLMQMLAEFL